MTPEARALLLDIAAICIESIRRDAERKPVQRRPLRCTVCGRTRIGCRVTICRICGGWMVYDAEQMPQIWDE